VSDKSVALSLANRIVPLCPGMTKRRPTYYQGHWLWPSASNWQSLFSRYEPKVGATIKRNLRLGGVFFDIGAHVGWFTLFAAKIVGPSGRVFSFEPAPDVYALLSENVHDLKNVRTLGCGIGNIDGDLEFAAHGTLPTGSFVEAVTEINRRFAPDTPIQNVKVDIHRIDTLLPQMKAPDLVKIDVEGFELNVLDGAKQLLTLQPALIIEIHPPQLKLSNGSEAAIFEILTCYGYSWTVIDRNPNSLYTIYATPRSSD